MPAYPDFKDGGSARGRRTQRLLFLNNTPITAEIRQDLKDARGRTVYVVRGHHVADLLTGEIAQRLRKFSDWVADHRGGDRVSESTAYKTAVEDIEKRPGKYTKAGVIVWKDGPIPAVRIGTAAGVPVLATPAPPRRRTEVLVRNAEREQQVVHGVIGGHLDQCLRTYVDQMADILRNAFFNDDRTQVFKAIQAVQSIMSRSVVPKLQKDREERRRQLDIAAGSPLRQHVQMYAAAASVIRAAIDVLTVCVDGGVEELEEGINNAADEVRALADGDEKEALLRCIPLLRGFGHIPAVPVPDGRRPHWLIDLELACAVIAHLRAFVREGLRDALCVYISYHMGTWASTNFVREITQYAERNWPRVKVWSAEHDTEQIGLSIVSRIWWSQAHVLYVPNTLVMKADGQPKALNDSNDWVVGELAIGAKLGKRLQLVVADNSKEVKRSLVKQLETYDWKTITSLIRGPADDRAVDRKFEGLAEKVEWVFENLRFVRHDPGAASFEDNGRLFGATILERAMQVRIDEMVARVRDSFAPRHWKLAVALRAHQLAHPTDEVTLEQWAEFAQQKRKGLMKVLREHLVPVEVDAARNLAANPRRTHKAVGVHVDGQFVPLIEERRRSSRTDSVRFAFDALVDALLTYYQLPFSRKVALDFYESAIRK